jgi:glycosyltransferase involved in cell wall biosynthesis
MPLRSRRDGRGRLLEAAAMAQPIIASGQAQAALDLAKADAPLCRCDRPEDWIETIWRLWHDPAQRLKLGAAAHRWAALRCTWPGAAMQLVDFLNQMLPAAEKMQPRAEQIPETLGPLPLRTSRRQAA